MERIPSIVTQSPDLPLWKSDPFLPVDWRVRDATRLVEGRTACWADTGDPDVEEYAEYLRSFSTGETHSTRPSTASQWATIGAARQLAQQDDPVRWLVEAAILAGESDEQVAARCGLSPSVIAAFERFFFSVRDSLKAEGWILTQVIGRGVWQGFRDEQLDRLWRGFSYFGGPLILDTLATHFFRSWHPGKPPTISVYFTERSTAPLELQAAIAAHAIPVNETTGLAFMQIHGELVEIEKTMSGTRAEAAKDELRRATIRLWRSGPAALRPAVPSSAPKSADAPASRTERTTVAAPPPADDGIAVPKKLGELG